MVNYLLPALGKSCNSVAFTEFATKLQKWRCILLNTLKFNVLRESSFIRISAILLTGFCLCTAMPVSPCIISYKSVVCISIYVSILYCLLVCIGSFGLFGWVVVNISFTSFF